MDFSGVLTGVVCLLLLGGLIGPAGAAAVDGGTSGMDATKIDASEIDATTLAQEDGTTGENETRENETPEDGGAETTRRGSVDPATVDAAIEEAMAEYDVAGATAAVVEGNETVHTEGYGYADYAAEEGVDPNETSFMIGSVSKLFVWTLVMQGVEEGTLDLDEPIDTYLDDYEFEGDDEVTLEHLGTHTPGYEDRLAGIFVEDHDAVDDWEGNLERNMPAQIREPGETVAYSNHGAALAGLVLQEAYDRPFEDLVAERIYEPLEMDSATFEQPRPEGHGPISKGHVPSGDGFETDDAALVGVPPAGSMSATAPDMGTFASAALQNGTFADERLLENASVGAMFEERATNHPGVNGVGYGYMRTERGGEQVVWHTGGTEYFTTLFALFPERDVGLFVSFNSPGGGLATMDVLDAFVEERFGGDAADGAAGTGEDGGRAGSEGDSAHEPATERAPDPATADRADRYEGEYRTTAFQTTYESVIGIADAWSVSVTDDGTLELSNPLGGDASRWIEVEPGVFEQDPDDDAQLSTTAIAIEDGTLYLDAPAAPYERVSWYETAMVQLGLFAVALGTILSPFLVWPVSAYRSRGWGRMREHLTRPRLAVLACAGVLLAFLVGLLGNVAASPEQLAYGLSPVLRIVFGLLAVLALAALVAMGLVGLEWRQVLDARDSDAGSTNRYGLAYLTLVVLALAVLVWQLWYWNFLTAAF